MSRNDQSVVVVESTGFSDKKIKLSKKQDGLTVGGQRIHHMKNEVLTVGGELISDYLSDNFISDIQTELEQEKRQDIGICRKPYLKYPRHKEPNGQGEIFDRAKINRLYARSNMENLNKRKANKIEYILTAFLTGKAFTFHQLSDYIKEKSGKEFGATPLNNTFLGVKRSKIFFLFKRVAKYPQAWVMDQRATQIKQPDLYQLWRAKGDLSLEDACLKYPFITKIIEETGGPKIQLPTRKYDKKANKKIDPVESETIDDMPKFKGFEPLDIEPACNDENPLEKLAQILTKNDGKIDFNINVNFKIKFGE